MFLFYSNLFSSACKQLTVQLKSIQADFDEGGGKSEALEF